MSSDETGMAGELPVPTATAFARSHELARLSSLQIADLAKDHAVVVQPIGSIEQHGPHLPVVTDAYIAESLVRGSVSLLGDDGPEVWILPTLSYGRSIEHLGFVGTVTLSTDTLLGVCRDVGRSVAASGFRRLIFVNGHGGNVALLDVVSRDIRIDTGLLVFRIMPSQFGLPQGLDCPDADFGAHADFVETSVMLALDESMVHLERAQIGGESAERLFGKQQTHALGPSSPTAWLTRDLSGNGVIGDPRNASAEIGRRIVDTWQRRLATCYREIANFEFDPSQ
jgi:creatinine amidohydrolase/Fe(II)-dependent formamide hydrolase-like protein